MAKKSNNSNYEFSVDHDPSDREEKSIMTTVTDFQLANEKKNFLCTLPLLDNHHKRKDYCTPGSNAIIYQSKQSHCNSHSSIVFDAAAAAAVNQTIHFPINQMVSVSATALRPLKLQIDENFINEI
ncbi:unnamed protein product [Ceratitis capitata]|uniref:(Mediterranean fruit fly) hypothetical protein n=1 Tax=Ceratitis capitata TaxID=7213 RepID=A0A811V913_CERCA|nr:unnamed protein product [Ceratitis capitata]